MIGKLQALRDFRFYDAVDHLFYFFVNYSLYGRVSGPISLLDRLVSFISLDEYDVEFYRLGLSYFQTFVVFDPKTFSVIVPPQVSGWTILSKVSRS